MRDRLLALVALLAGCATAPPPAAEPAPDEAAVVRIDGQPISARALAAHMDRSGLPRDEALEDLIDLTLLRQAARAKGVPLEDGVPSAPARAAAEYAVGLALAVELPAAQAVIVVDHAWIKDSDKKKVNAAQKAGMDRLRALVAAGSTLPAAAQQLKLDDAWHVGDHEEYPADVIPPAARALQPGALSAVIAGDGGLHLFKVHAHKQSPPAPDVVRPLVRARLREGKKIERP